MEIFLVGVGDAFSTKHWGTSFLLRRGDFVMAVDCPDSYLRALAEHAWPHLGGTFNADHIDALFLTHLHGDHVNGLEMLLAWRTFVTKSPLELYTTPEVAEVLWDRRLSVSLGSMWDGQAHNPKRLSDYANLHIVPWGEETHIGPFELTTRATLHHLPAAAMRVACDGKIWAYSCDTAFDPELIAWLAEGDLIFHETSYGPAHTPIECLEALEEKLKRKLILVHLPDTLIASKNLSFGIQGECHRLF